MAQLATTTIYGDLKENPTLIQQTKNGIYIAGQIIEV